MNESASRSPTPLQTSLCIGLMCLIWGSTWLVIKEGLRDLPPFTSAGLRFLLAATVMCAVAHVMHRREGGERPPIWLSLVTGTGNFGISYGIVYWSETILPSGLVSVLWAVFPMMMAFCGHWFLPGERLRAAQALGFLLGFLGVVVLFHGDFAAFGPSGWLAAFVLLSSPLVSAIATTFIKRYGENVSSVLLNRNGMFVGALLLLSAAAVSERDEKIEWSRSAVLSIAYLSLVGSVIAFGLYFWLLRYAPAHRLSLVAYVIPVVALTLGWLIGGEEIAAHTLAGTALILVGVFLVLRWRGGGVKKIDSEADRRATR